MIYNTLSLTGPIRYIKWGTNLVCMVSVTNRGVAKVATVLIVVLTASHPVGGLVTPHEPQTNASVYFLETPEPGATDITMWSSTVTATPSQYEGETYEANFSISWTPLVASGCQLENVKTFGIDRGNDDPGTEVDESAIQAVSNDSTFETGVKEYQDQLSTTEWDYVEKVMINWNNPNNSFTSNFQVQDGDQFIVEQDSCYALPDKAGWYRDRQKSIGVIGSISPKERYTQTYYSHWYYICDCESYDAATETLGPPPSKAGSSTPTTSPDNGGPATPPPTASPPQTLTGTETQSTTTSETITPTSATSRSPTLTATLTNTVTETVPPKTTTATEEVNQPGFGPIVGLVGVLIAALLAGYRN